MLGAIGAGVYSLAIRPWHLRWGATDDEVRRPLPGDDELDRPLLDATRAVTIAAPPAAVWPWLVQMGYRRAGFYAIDWIDNDGIPSANRIILELQRLEVGELLPTGPSGGFMVTALDPPRFLVGVIRDPRFHVSFCLALEPLDMRTTRLIARVRVDVRLTDPRLALYFLIFEPGDFVMMRQMLLGIKARAERAWQGGEGGLDDEFARDQTDDGTTPTYRLAPQSIGFSARDRLANDHPESSAPTLDTPVR
jgi:hypothetical protein